MLRETIEIDEELCDGCGECVPACEEGAIRIVEGKARIIEGLCDGLGHCIGDCPQGAISKVLRDTGPAGGSRSWPLKIELVPENAPFLRGEAVIAADCAGFASPDIQEILGDRPVLIGCPKLKDRAAYLDKLERIFRSSDLDSIELVLMEVPCCSGMHSLVLEALERADEDLPLSKVIIGIDGGCRHGR